MNTITISSRELFSKCDRLARVINSKNSLPALDNFLFKVTDGTMYISASDTENFATATLSLVDSMDTFEFGLNARTFVSALKEIPEQPITIEISNNGCIVRYTNGHFNLPVTDVKEYPQFPKMREPNAVSLTTDALKRILSKTPAFAVQDELRPIMGGICFSYENRKLETAASDGHSLIRLTEECENDGKGLFVMSIKTAKLAESFREKEKKR